MFSQIVLGLSLAGCLLAGFVYWWKRELFLTGVVAAFFALLIGVVTLTFPNMPPVAQQLPEPEPNQPPAQPAPRQAKVVRWTSQKTFEPYRPAEVPSDGYVGSDACQACHQHNHKTWHASYHRTMTQVATKAAVIGDFDDVHVIAKNRDYVMSRDGDVCRVEMNDPDLPVTPATRMTVPIVMTTGSHHMQVYWYPIRTPRTLGRVPIVYLKETQQWVPRSAIFLEPPDSEITTEFGRWNGGCTKCHSTHSRERKRPGGTWDTEVTEFGISCEACHGPGQAHVQLHENPTGLNVADPIVNPADLDHRASSHVCGQCHCGTSNRESMDLVNVQGHGYRPGKDLNETHHIWQRDSQVVRSFLNRMDFQQGDEVALRRMFWDDGNVRVSGREFAGMERSSCYQRGELSCLSCHQMHQQESDPRPILDWANDQLAPIGLDDRACTQCHSAGDYGTDHTHHAANSSGSSCYNCHMPHTSYGLLKAIRSHTITSPNVVKDQQAIRPNACNLCHLDKTLQWTSETMSQWYGTEPAELTDEQKSVAAAVIWLLKGDAGHRALAAWSMGWESAHEASGTDWIAPLLARLLMDEYEAIRFITRRSLRRLPGFAEFEFDAIGDETQRFRAMKTAQEKWQREFGADHTEGDQILMDGSGLQAARADQLSQQRDETSIRLME